MAQYEITAVYRNEDGDEIVSIFNDKDDKKKETYPVTGLKITNGTSELILGFNNPNLSRLVPYFIYCLENDKRYEMEVCKYSYITIYSSFIEFEIIYDQKLNQSLSSIKIAKSDCVPQLIRELSKAGYKSFDDYNKFMDAVYYNNYCAAYLFMRGPLKVVNDTRAIVIDKLTTEEENKFKQLLSSDGEITVRGIIYKTENDIFTSIDKTTGGKYTCRTAKQVLVNALDHIY